MDENNSDAPNLESPFDGTDSAEEEARELTPEESKKLEADIKKLGRIRTIIRIVGTLLVLAFVGAVGAAILLNMP